MAASSTTCCASWRPKRMALARNTLAGLSFALALTACSGETDERENSGAAPAPSLIPQLASLETGQTDRGVFVMGIDAQSFARRMADEDARIIDVRTPAEFAQGAIPGAENIPLDAFGPEDFAAADGKRLLLYCRSGRRSGIALSRLEAAGIQGAVHLTGGILAWEAQGLPTELP